MRHLIGFGFGEVILLVVVALLISGRIGRRGRGRTVPVQHEDGMTALARIPQRAALGGVCAGFAYYFSWPVWVARLLAAVLAFFGGAGVILYVLLWILMPVAEALPHDFDGRTQ
jgi:phage shock protein PspC (stress-responsive transcriptional regulator)